MWLALSKGSLLNVTPEELSGAIGAILHELVADGSLNLASEEIPEPKVERPRNRDHGDWATNVAMQLAKKAGTNPRALAQLLTERLTQNPGIASAEIAGPGFINIRLDAASAGELARTILTAGTNYGCNTSLAGQNINLEYVSANPTGPVHLGGARWAAVGDSLARIFKASGAQVTREYYFNDHGTQIDRFVRSLIAAARGEETPEDGYAGAYIVDIKDQILAQRPDALEAENPEEIFREIGTHLMFDQIKESLEAFGTHFDVFFHENSVFEGGKVDALLNTMRENGQLFEADGAWWMRTTDYGDDKDRVVIKSDGHHAYVAGDIAYYQDKMTRAENPADVAIYMLGADHNGYVGRLKAIAQILGYRADQIEVMIGQLVNLVKDGKPVRMSKRAGTVVTLEDLVEAVGVDAARYELTRYSVDTPIDIDLGLLTSKSNENPVYYVQYAHARTAAVARNAAEAGVKIEDGVDTSLLDSAADGELLAVLGQFPAAVRDAAKFYEPHRVNRYLEQLASAYHSWYGVSRVTPKADEEVTDLHRTRLLLNNAAQQVLANGLSLLGVSAPERM